MITNPAQRPRTRWRCTICGQPVELAHARAHYDQCAGGDQECLVCGEPMPVVGAVCARCAEVVR